MGFPRKLLSKSCFIIIALLFTALLFSTTSGEEVSHIFFSENFDGTEVDTAKWIVQENTNMSGNPAYGGSVKVAESQIFLSSSGSSFPWVQTVANPFPTTGDFAVEFDFTYTCVADLGNGFGFLDGPIRSGRPSFFGIWANDMGPDEVEIYLVFLGKRVYQSTTPGWKPSTDKHFYRLEYIEGVYTVYVDGTVVASEPSERRPIAIGFGHAPRYDIPLTKEQVEAYGYWGWHSFKIDAIKVLVKDPAKLSMQTCASAAQIGYMVDISGNLTSPEGAPLQYETVLLSYSPSESLNWQSITAVTTDKNGFYSASWIPTATGNFILKAEWNGNEMYSGTYDVKNISVCPYASESLFFAESNSTLSSLAFNSTSKEISFTVNGTSGTTGYVKVTIAKSLVANAENIKVHLDGKPLNYEVTSNANALLLTFTYGHSSHRININLAASTATMSVIGIVLWIAICATPIAVAISVCLLFYFKKRKH